MHFHAKLNMDLKLDQPGFLCTSWKKDHILMYSYNRLFFGVVAFNALEKTYKFSSEPFDLSVIHITKIFDVILEISSTFVDGPLVEEKKLKSLVYEDQNKEICVTVRELSAALELKVKGDTVTTVYLHLNDLQGFLTCFVEAIPIVATLDKTQIKSFRCFVFCANEVSLEECQSSSNSNTLTGNAQSILNVLSKFRSFQNCKEMTGDGFQFVTKIVAKVIENLKLKSSYEALLLEHFVFCKFDLYRVYYYAFFKANSCEELK